MKVIYNYNLNDMIKFCEDIFPTILTLEYLGPYDGSHLYEISINGIKNVREDLVYSLIIERYYLNDERKVSIIRDIREYAKYKQKN